MPTNISALSAFSLGVREARVGGKHDCGNGFPPARESQKTSGFKFKEALAKCLYSVPFG
jgi:hypothetical protein